MERYKHIAKFIIVVIVSYVFYKAIIVINTLAISMTQGFNQLMFLLYAQWSLPIVILILAKRDQISFEELGLKKIKIINIVLGFLVGVSLHILNSIVMNIGSDTAFYEETTFVNWNTIIFNSIYNLFGVAVNEEILFRGYLPALLKRCSDIPQIIQIFIISFIFGVFHLGNLSLSGACRAVCIGLVLASLMAYGRKFTLLSAITAHATYNTLSLIS